MDSARVHGPKSNNISQIVLYFCFKLESIKMKNALFVRLLSLVPVKNLMVNQNLK